MLSFQVLLDREGFSPGEITARDNQNFDRALVAFQSTRGIESEGKPDCDSWLALGGETAEPTTPSYVVIDDDMRGPFEKIIPRDLNRQAELPSLGYRSALEMLAERFHASPALLRTLNSDARALGAGTTIVVPAVKPFDPRDKPDLRSPAERVTVSVSREDSSLRVTRADGSLAFFAPVSSGSEHDPLPVGDWKVTGVKWRPVFHYNPKLFWDAGSNDSTAEIKPGPKNPVGVVWIALDLAHYGLHGTPEPSHVGYTESHGCVRLTNWDAVRVATLVRPGVPVQFR
jgi:lipoprotein-anchoring transpeptidase ErfK/SrfK